MASKKGKSAMTDQQWNMHTPASGTKVIMDTVGDVFIGTFTGIEHIVPEDTSKEEFDQVTFKGTDGESYSMPASYKLIRAFRAIQQGTLCRMELKNLVDTGQPSPMKDIEIQTAE